MTSIEHLIFDFDGTISNSYPIFMTIVHDFAKEKGLPIPVDDDTLFRALNITVKYAIELMEWDKQVSYQDFLDFFYEQQALRAKEFCAFPEAVELLEYAQKRGKHCYIYTHTGSVVSQMLKNMGIFHYFDFILDGSYGFPAKPCPDALNFFSKKLGLDPQSCMMIGDRPIDAQAGMNAGMHGCLWDSYGFFEDEHVDYKVKRLSEIKYYI